MVSQGRSSEGIREASRAAELDPLSAQVLNNYALVLTYARKYEEAADQARRALELEPSAEGHQYLGQAYLFKGKFGDAIQELQTALDLLGGCGRTAPNLSRLGIAYARAGQRDKALGILEDMKRLVASGDQTLTGYAVSIAYLYGELGDHDRAFESLERARQEHEYVLTNLRVNPLVDSLRSDPRFQQTAEEGGAGGVMVRERAILRSA